jgi:thioredoxin reductase (NADPH)
VVDYTGEGAEEAGFLADFCARVFYLNLTKKEQTFKKSNIESITGDQPVEITGGDTVSALQTRNRNIPTDGVFIFRETYPPGEMVPGVDIEEGSIKVNRKMETNLEGLYAAGDCTGKPYQVAKSVGEGQAAALHAVSYLDRLEKSTP